MNFFKFITQDWKVNKDNSKGRIFLFLFRIANFCKENKFYFYIGIPYILFYKIFIQWIYTLEIPWNIKIGKNLSIYHGQALILNKDVIIGNNCTLRQSTTIGLKTSLVGKQSQAPVIGNFVDIGNNVSIIGPIVIHDNVIIGSGSVVIKDVAGNCVIAGNPALKKRDL